MTSSHPPGLHLASLLAALISVTALHPVSAAPQISEFMAVNDSTLADEDGEFSDWIEIRNPDAGSLSLAGYHLTEDAANLTKWTFPAVTIPPGGYLIVFASNKDRTDPGSQLHTNFRLTSSGEYLALVEPDGTTIASEFAPVYPPQFPDESFGFGTPGASNQIDITPSWSSPGNYYNVKLNGTQSANLTASNDSIDADLNGSQLQYYMWFDLSSQLGLIAPGDTIDSATLSWSGNVSASIFGTAGVVSELGVFPVPDANHGIDTIAASYNANVLVNYFAAHPPAASYTAVPGQDTSDYLGHPQPGRELARQPRSPTARPADDPQQCPPDLHGLGSGRLRQADPEGSGLHHQRSERPRPTSVFRYRHARRGQCRRPARWPSLRRGHREPGAAGRRPLTITAEIAGSVDPVTGIDVFYRLGFGAETRLAMADDGNSPDAVAGDGTWTATIPAAAIQPGEMTRWRFVASDSSGAQTRKPAFREPLDSHEYFGTVGVDPAIQTKLSVVHWFVQNPAGANKRPVPAVRVYYLGEFYDNVYFNRHGQSTGGFPKKSYNIDFNKTQRFRWQPRTAPRVNGHRPADQLGGQIQGAPRRSPGRSCASPACNAHFAFTVRVEQNGEFFSTADFVEDARRHLPRARRPQQGRGTLQGLQQHAQQDNGNTANSGVEKKNRKGEDNSDLQALIDGLDLTGPALVQLPLRQHRHPEVRQHAARPTR